MLFKDIPNKCLTSSKHNKSPDTIFYVEHENFKAGAKAYKFIEEPPKVTELVITNVIIDTKGPFKSEELYEALRDNNASYVAEFYDGEFYFLVCFDRWED